jgi:hypothetical protein
VELATVEDVTDRTPVKGVLEHRSSIF